MAKRIDTLKQGAEVTLKFHGSKRFGNAGYTEDATFLDITGVGDDRRAKFSVEGEEFEAYRFSGHWAYGTSAERLSLV